MRKNHTLQSRMSNKEKRFTLIILTILSGLLLLGYVVFKGIKHRSEVEIGIDFTIYSRGSSENKLEFFK